MSTGVARADVVGHPSLAHPRGDWTLTALRDGQAPDLESVRANDGFSYPIRKSARWAWMGSDLLQERSSVGRSPQGCH